MAITKCAGWPWATMQIKRWKPKKSKQRAMHVNPCSSDFELQRWWYGDYHWRSFLFELSLNRKVSNKFKQAVEYARTSAFVLACISMSENMQIAVLCHTEHKAPYWSTMEHQLNRPTRYSKLLQSSRNMPWKICWNDLEPRLATICDAYFFLNKQLNFEQHERTLSSILVQSSNTKDRSFAPWPNDGPSVFFSAIFGVDEMLKYYEILRNHSDLQQLLSKQWTQSCFTKASSKKKKRERTIELWIFGLTQQKFGLDSRPNLLPQKPMLGIMFWFEVAVSESL